MRRILLAIATGLLVGLGAAPATAASAQVTAPSECQLDDPSWQVSWASEDAVTLKECGGEGGWSEAGGSDDGGTLPVTGLAAGVVTGAAIVMVGMGAGIYLLTHRRRVTFTA